jgi:hypothetical protein
VALRQLAAQVEQWHELSGLLDTLGDRAEAERASQLVDRPDQAEVGIGMSELADGLAQDPRSEQTDQIGLLGDGDELPRAG